MAGLLHLSQFLQYACTFTHKSTDHCNYQHSICVAPHIFGAPYRTKCPGDQILIGRGVPMMQKQCDTRLQKTKPMVVNKTRKVEIHVADNQPRNSCMKAASDHGFTFGSAIEPTKKKHNALWPCTVHGHLLQPQHGASAVWIHWPTRLSFVLNQGLNFVGK